LIQNVKSESTKWIKQQRLSTGFAWQEGYGAFFYSKQEAYNVIHYIENQEIQHRKETFLNEYRGKLVAAGIQFDEQYIFKEPI
jgi:putative transposase